ncbi:MAG: hypothetical protein RL094_91 [Candidatus Parcubacteria bacterium]
MLGERWRSIAPVVQWIELRTSKPSMLVRFQPGAQNIKRYELLHTFFILCQPELCFLSKENERGGPEEVFERRRKNYPWAHKKKTAAMQSFFFLVGDTGLEPVTFPV